LYILSLYLKDFRNYRESRVEFSEKTNLILGNNGRGKTNLLESIYLLSTSKSFRRISDQRIKRWGTDGYLIQGRFHNGAGETSISLKYADRRKQLAVNGVKESRISDIIGHVYTVLLSFEDTALITGPPYLRRGLLDLILSTVDPLYFDTLRTYMHAVKQKNRYLSTAEKFDAALFDAWNDALVDAGSYIIERRMFLMEFLNRFLLDRAGELAQFSTPLQLRYRSSIQDDYGDSVRERFAAQLAAKVDTERRLRRAAYGPHRDDFAFHDNRSEIRYFSSIGEARLASIVLKLAQASYYESKRGIRPILLVDDIFLELDSANRERVLSLFGGENQILVTTTERPRLPEIFSPDRVFHLGGDGSVEWN
jgi:DNA replication and repair protein RecF